MLPSLIQSINLPKIYTFCLFYVCSGVAICRKHIQHLNIGAQVLFHFNKQFICVFFSLAFLSLYISSDYFRPLRESDFAVFKCKISTTIWRRKKEKKITEWVVSACISAFNQLDKRPLHLLFNFQKIVIIVVFFVCFFLVQRLIQIVDSGIAQRNVFNGFVDSTICFRQNWSSKKSAFHFRRSIFFLSAD